jgi:hypothetical protein
MEADNFECDEICEIVESHARETIAAFSLPRDEIRATVEAEAQRTEGKGVAEIVLASAASHDPPLTLESGKDTLAELLMKHAIGHPKLRGEDRPILVLAEHLVRLAGAHRRLRGKLRS